MERCNQSNKKQRERSHLISLKKLIEKYGKMVPDLSIWLENELPEGFTVFNVKPDSLECASETPDNQYGGISKQGKVDGRDSENLQKKRYVVTICAP